MFDILRNYIEDRSFHFQYLDSKLDVVNYLELVVLEESRITLRYTEGLFIIKGSNLSVNKLLDNEILISGHIQSMEFGGR